MVPPQINLAVLDDDARWADDSECFDLLCAGTWFLHDVLETRHPKCPLLKRIKRLGDRFQELFSSCGSDASQLNVADVSAFFQEANTLGTLGHSLWRLREYFASRGLRYEIKELSQIGMGENPAGDRLRLRGQGFLLFAAGHLAHEGFKLEFIERRDAQQTPDFFAFRDGHSFTCEVTNRYPETGAFDSVEFFWTTIHEVVEKKKGQLTGSEFSNGVLIVDCTPVWEAFGLSHVPIGGQLVVSIPENGALRTTSSPLVRYDTSPNAIGLCGLEDAIRGTNIENVILWNHKLETSAVGYHRRMEYRILGTIRGCVFWSYFPKACVFPGPKVNVVWPPE